MEKVKIGIIGGSGLYQLLDNAKEIKVLTPYGEPSERIAIGKIGQNRVAFLPRHGKKHQFPPHKINYRANLWALKQLGTERIISLTAVGSLQKQIKRGDFVMIDQFIDRTSGRPATFFDGPETFHVSTAYPYCPELIRLTYKIGLAAGLRIHQQGTLVVIEGPRFSTRAESEWFTRMGWAVINMTGYPEAVLARELEMCYSAIGLVTDYDAGVVFREKLAPVSTEEVVKVFSRNITGAKKLLEKLIEKIPEKRNCKCKTALEGAKMN